MCQVSCIQLHTYSPTDTESVYICIYLYNIVPSVILLLQAIVMPSFNPLLPPSDLLPEPQLPAEVAMASSSHARAAAKVCRDQKKFFGARMGGQIWDRSDFCIDRICIHTHTDIYIYIHTYVYIYILLFV